MFGLGDVRQLHIELSSVCQARCPMCLREELVSTPHLEPTSITLENYQRWLGDVIPQLHYAFMCGNLGDPIMAPDALDILAWTRERNPRMGIGLHTNGSARPAAFWQRLAQLGVRVIFAIDGSPATHALYRLGTRREKIIANARAFITAGGVAEWQMLVFEHNEHEVEACRRESEDLGFSGFVVRHTTRFLRGDAWPVTGCDGTITHVLRPSSRSRELMATIAAEKAGAIRGISCKSTAPPQLYVAASGEVQPCCWMEVSSYPAGAPELVDRRAKLGAPPNLYVESLAAMFERGYFDDVARTWGDDPLRICATQCGNVDRLRSEFAEPSPNGSSR